VREAAAEPVDPDIYLRRPRQRRELRDAPWAVLGAISAGGVLGALARYGLSSAFPHAPGDFDWATFWINVSGCLVIGVLMVLITEAWEAHRLVRPFLGVGVLGGFTTFSTYIVDVQKALSAHHARTALLYLAATLIAALAAAYAGLAGTRWIIRTARDRERS
jgi:CrcB protein